MGVEGVPPTEDLTGGGGEWSGVEGPEAEGEDLTGGSRGSGVGASERGLTEGNEGNEEFCGEGRGEAEG